MDHLILYQKYVTNLSRVYGNQWRGNCPIKPEKTPENKAFCIDMAKGLYHCKSCGAEGNAITFAEEVGEVNYANRSNTKMNSYKKRELKNVDVYHKHLLDNLENAPRFWNTEIIKKLKVGWDIDKNNYVFPIYNDKNDLINVKHHKGIQFSSAKASLYPFHLLDTYDNSYIIITEGEKDVISLLSNGFQAITSTGGATVIPFDISALMRFNKIYICFDNDEAGDTGIDLWIQKIKTIKPKSYIRVCDISKYVGEGGDVTDYFATERKTQEPFIEEILDRSIWAEMPGSDISDYLRMVMLSDEMRKLSIRDQVVLFNLIIRATRYRVTTANFNGMRVRMKPGEYIKSYGKFAKLCGRGMTAKKVRDATNKLESLKLIRKGNLKMRRGMKFTLIGWIDETGHSKSHSEKVKTDIQNITFLSTKELINKFNNGNSEL